MRLFDYEPLFAELSACGLSECADHLRRHSERALQPSRHGHLSAWINAWQQLPQTPDATIRADPDAVTVSGSLSAADRSRLSDLLRTFHPWRKGPFELFGIRIDTEWRSNLKWDRIAGHIELRNRRVLDVGCGNGYYGWRMLQAGAELVLGFEPFLLYAMQFEILRRYAGGHCRHFVLPLSDSDIPRSLSDFDVTFSMGVLYHCTSPIDHLQRLRRTLKPAGSLVLETLIVDDSAETVLVPAGRYAKMRNVWFIPSIAMLQLWLTRTGFHRVRVLDVTRTTSYEQRSTEWMTFESLSDFLDPQDPAKTVEGYPGPVRAVLLAERR